MNANIGDRWLSTSDLCQYLCISNDTLYRLIQNNNFPAQKVGKHWMASRGQVDTWLSVHHSNNQDKSQVTTLSPSQNGKPWEIFKYPLPKEEECKYTHISLFSGCGGIDLGFRQAGFKTIFALDIDEDACLTYKENIGNITNGDICNISLPKIKKLDLLTAGFPCQPFSNAGSRKGFSDFRGSLFVSALNVVEQLSPKVVMFENVRGLLSSKHNGKYLIEII